MEKTHSDTQEVVLNLKYIAMVFRTQTLKDKELTA